MFTPAQERTNFYYQCGNHDGMGNQIIVENNNNADIKFDEKYNKETDPIESKIPKNNAWFFVT